MDYKQKYSEQIKSPKWQKRRLDILNRDNFTCQICGCTEKTLHVHHTIYIPEKQIWEYEDNQLITLCEDCHSKEHDESLHLVDDLIFDLKYQGLTNFEIDSYFRHHTIAAGGICVYPMIKEWKIINPSKSEKLARLAKRRNDIVNEKYNLNDD